MFGSALARLESTICGVNRQVRGTRYAKCVRSGAQGSTREQNTGRAPRWMKNGRIKWVLKMMHLCFGTNPEPNKLAMQNVQKPFPRTINKDDHALELRSS